MFERVSPFGTIPSMVVSRSSHKQDLCKFQVVSDLYLTPYMNERGVEQYITRKIVPKSEILLVAGNIADVWSNAYVIFLNMMSEKFKKVVLVMGNYEYNNRHTMLESETCLRDLIKEYENVFFLQKDMIHFMHNQQRYIILGCTLWTNAFTHFHDSCVSNNYTPNNQYTSNNINVSSGKLRNTEHILNGEGKPIDNFEIRELYKEHSAWILNKAAEIKYSNTITPHETTYPPYFSSGTIIVLTHHCPSRQLSKMKESLNQFDQNPEYYSDMEPWVSEHIRSWVCGHTETTNEHNSKTGTKYVTNCLNYQSASPSFYFAV